jgi:heat shock protein HslJ
VTDETVPLAYTEWTLVELAGNPVADEGGTRRPTLALDLEESRVSGSGGVNRIAGAFVLGEDELRFGPMMATRMAGPEQALQREQVFLDALGRVDSFELEGRTLTLLAGGEAIARLSC